MPLPMVSSSPPVADTLTTYPAVTKQAAGVIDDIPTNVISTQFSDKIVITIVQEGRLGQWVPFIILFAYLYTPDTLFRSKYH